MVVLQGMRHGMIAKEKGIMDVCVEVHLRVRVIIFIRGRTIEDILHSYMWSVFYWSLLTQSAHFVTTITTPQIVIHI